MARGVALAAALAVSLLAVAGAGGSPAQTPKRGGTVVIGTTTAFEPACLNVLSGCSTAPSGSGLPLDLSHVLAGAFEVTPDATFRPVLVSGARIVAKEPFTLVYRIRPEARWSDGVPVSAQDFVFTYQAFGRRVPSDADRVPARSLRPLDRKTFRLVLHERYVDWRYLFSIVLPRHALAGEDLTTVWRDGIDNPKTGASIGSGPFLVGNWQRGRQLTFVRSPRYWGPHAAYLNRVAYRFISPEDAADALRSGEIHMIHPGPAVLEAQHRELRLRPAPGIRVLTAASGGWEHLTIRVGDGGHAWLEKRLVRQALAYGLDRVAIARAIGQLSFEPVSTSGPQDSMVFPKISRHYRPNWSGYRRREARAHQLLEQAGCRRGADGIYSCGGDRLSLRLGTVAGIERRELTVKLAQQQLRRVGIEAQLVFARPADFFGRIGPGGDFDVVSSAWFPGASTVGPGVNLQCQREENWSGYCDRLLTRDLVQVTRTLDSKRRIELLNRIDSRLAKAVPHIPLYEITGLFAHSARVRGMGPVGGFTWNVEDWWLAE